MNRPLHILLLTLLLLAAAITAPAQEKISSKRVRGNLHRLYENSRARATGEISMSPDEYEHTIRQLFREDRWEDAEPYLQAAEREWGEMSVICYLYGRYWQHEGDNNQARRYLLSATRDDEANTEALEALVKLEEQEKNYSTAIVHVNDLLKYSPYNKRLWRKKIELYRLSGNDVEANRLLERLVNIYPEDEQIRKDLIYQKELEYQQLRREGNEQEVRVAIEQLIIRNPGDAQYYIDLSASQLRDGQVDEALATCAKGVENTHGSRALISRRVSILSDQARYAEAEIYLDGCIRRYGSSGLTNLRSNLREEAAQAADHQDAYTRYRNLYGTTHSAESLDWLITNSMRRGWWDDAQYYVREARTARGDSPELLAKAWLVEKRLGNERAASRLLEERYQADTADLEVRELLAEKRLSAGTALMLDELWGDALVQLQQADVLATDSDTHQLIERRMNTCRSMMPDTTRIDSLGDDDWMTRSIRYEKQHNLDSAYACLMRYRPSLEENHYVTRHRHTLLARLLKNNLTLESQYARRSSIDEWTHNTYITYSHNFGHDVLEVLGAYAGRESSSWTEQNEDGVDTTITSSGGTGVQLGAGYTHYFGWGDIAAQASWANQFLPRATAKLAITWNLPNEWTLTERNSWRYIADNGDSYHVLSSGLSAGWRTNCFYLSPSVDAFLMQQHVYFNGGVKMQYFPLDGDRSHVFAVTGAGNAPELSLLDSSLPVRFAHLNTNMAVGGYYMINGHLGLSGTATWYVMGNNDQTVRNYLYLNFSMNIAF